MIMRIFRCSSRRGRVFFFFRFLKRKEKIRSRFFSRQTHERARIISNRKRFRVPLHIFTCKKYACDWWRVCGGCGAALGLLYTILLRRRAERKSNWIASARAPVEYVTERYIIILYYIVLAAAASVLRRYTTGKLFILAAILSRSRGRLYYNISIL